MWIKYYKSYYLQYHRKKYILKEKTKFDKIQHNNRNQVDKILTKLRNNSIMSKKSKTGKLKYEIYKI